jgi:hypothetical protein
MTCIIQVMKGLRVQDMRQSQATTHKNQAYAAHKAINSIQKYMLLGPGV